MVIRFVSFVLSIACSCVCPCVVSFGTQSLGLGSRAARHRLQPLSTAMDAFMDGENRRRMSEFKDLEPLPENELRKRRMELNEKVRKKFVEFGDDLWELRSSIEDLSGELFDALERGREGREQKLRESLREAERRDPELVYKLEVIAAEDARLQGNEEDAQKHKAKAAIARGCLPQFNLEGLWVGKYGKHGYEMINVTYVGDVLIAYKVTGDKNVPQGEISFQADLNPRPPRLLRNGDERTKALQPIMLTDKASKRWGTKQLPRYRGVGQVAETGFVNNQWLDGQLIIIGKDYFSFAWIPLEHQIFFGRPSPELALKMLKEGGASSLKQKAWDEPPSLHDDVSTLKEYAAHVMEVTTETIEDELKGQQLGCIWHHGDGEECYFQ